MNNEPKDRFKDVYTFPEFVEYGRNNGGNIVNGMPWSFNFFGHPVTHENDNCYLIPTGAETLRFTSNDALILEKDGSILIAQPQNLSDELRNRIIQSMSHLSEQSENNKYKETIDLLLTELSNVRDAILNIYPKDGSSEFYEKWLIESVESPYEIANLVKAHLIHCSQQHTGERWATDKDVLEFTDEWQRMFLADKRPIREILQQFKKQRSKK